MRGTGRRFTVATIQEGEKEEKGQARDEMPVELPQQFLLINGIRTVLVCRAIRAGLVDLCLFFLIRHGWRERRGRRGETCWVVGRYMGDRCVVRDRERSLSRVSRETLAGNWGTQVGV